MSMILVGVSLSLILIGIVYWLSLASRGRGYHSERIGHEERLKLKRKQEEMKFQAREAERQRRIRESGRGFRGT